MVIEAAKLKIEMNNRSGAKKQIIRLKFTILMLILQSMQEG